MIIKGLPKFSTEKEFFKFLVEKEDLIFSQAKAQIKEADAMPFLSQPLKEIFSNKSYEEETAFLMDKDVIYVKPVINTTGILDSHKDVHIPSLWNKSLEENKRIIHVQEHKSREFDKIISSGEDLKAYVEETRWRDLGFDFNGKTEALMFDSKVRKDRNAYMHGQYAKKYVDNHSVGMYYIKLATCINDKDYSVQFENYEKYEQYVVNREALDVNKYFWAVLEAKVIEGSAVPNGSNWATPTTSTKGFQNNKSEQLKQQAFIEWLKK